MAESVEAKKKRYEAELSTLVAGNQKPSEAEVDYRVGLEAAREAMMAERGQVESAEAEELVGTVPDSATAYLARFVQGSRAPLSRVGADAVEALRSVGVAASLAATCSKIKLTAERRAYGTRSKFADLYEDESLEAVWRWEVELDVLGAPGSAAAKEARSERKKLGTRVKALRRLLDTLEKSPDDAAKISRDEEKVLKFQREDEAARLKAQAQLRKKMEKEAEDQKKKQEKEEKLEKKTAEEARKKLKKEQILQAKHKAQEADRKKLEAVQKQQSVLAAFVRGTKKAPVSDSADKNSANDASPTAAPAETKTTTNQTTTNPPTTTKNKDQPRTSILLAKKPDTEPVEIDLEKCRTDAPMTVRELSAFFEDLQDARRLHPKKNDALDDDDEVVVVGEEKEPPAKFFFFHDEYRGAYFDRSNRTSTVVTGLTPLEKDPAVDYDRDSDAEFAANDAEVEDAEDINQDDDDDDRACDDDDALDYADGFLAADDQAPDESQDGDADIQAEENTPVHRSKRLVVQPRLPPAPLPDELLLYKPAILFDPFALPDRTPSKKPPVIKHQPCPKQKIPDDGPPPKKKSKTGGTPAPGQSTINHFFSAPRTNQPSSSSSS